MSNEITAYFKGRTGVVESVYQYDYGKVLVIDGLDLPAVFEVHFANSGDDTSITVIGQDNRAAIPNSCLEKADVVTAYIYAHEGENDGETEYIAKFNVIRRAMPVDDDVSRKAQSAISKAVALLQSTNANILETIEEDVGEYLAEHSDGSIQEWLDDHPEATTTVQDDSLTTIKYKDESVTRKKISSDLNKRLEQVKLSICRYGRILDAFGENNTTRTLYSQSVVYDEDNSLYYVSGSYNDNANQKINIYSDTGILQSSHDYTALGHAHGMALYEGDLYINNHDEIVIVDTATMEITDTIDIPSIGLINSLSIEDGVMYVCGRQTVDPIITYVSYDFATSTETVLFTIDLPKNILVQSCLYHDGYFYHLYNRSNQIYKIDASNGECVCVYDVPTDDGYYYVGEAECLYMKDGRICLMGNGEYVFSSSYPAAAFALLFETSLTGLMEGFNQGLYVQNVFPRNITINNAAAYSFNPYDTFTCLDEINLIKDVRTILITACNGGTIIGRDKSISIIGTANKTNIDRIVMWGGQLILRNAVVKTLLYFTGCRAYLDVCTINGTSYLNCSVIDAVNTLFVGAVTNYTGSLIRLNGVTEANLTVNMNSGLITSNSKIEIYLDRVSTFSTFMTNLIGVLTPYASSGKAVRITFEALVSGVLYPITISPVVSQIINGSYSVSVNGKTLAFTSSSITYDGTAATIRQVRIVL